MKITKKILEKIIREEAAKVLAEDSTSSREHWMSGGLENGITAAETAAQQLGDQGSSIMRAKLELSAAAQWFDWLERLGVDPKEEGSHRGEESPQERYRHYSEMYTSALKVLSDRAQALDLVGKLNQPEDPTQSVDFVKKTLQENDLQRIPTSRLEKIYENCMLSQGKDKSITCEHFEKELERRMKLSEKTL